MTFLDPKSGRTLVNSYNVLLEVMREWLWATTRIFGLLFKDHKYPLVFVPGVINDEQASWWYRELDDLIKRRKEMNKTYYKFFQELKELKPKRK